MESLKKTIENYNLKLPEYYREMFMEEFYRTFNRYECLKPLEWKKWGKALMNLIITLK